MAKTIVVCCDGTWDNPASQTNIWKTFELIADSLEGVTRGRIGDDRQTAAGRTPDGRECLAYYDTGVGARRFERGSGGVFGVGLGENVKQAYAVLAEAAQPEDELFLFGFSRGAFTIRSLSGLLGCAGLPTAGGTAAVDAAWRYYRCPPAARLRSAEAEELAAHAPRGVRIRFLGVYDTVGSLGVPVPQLGFLNAWLERLLGGVIRFHDTTLGRNVEVACQALAIHERRGSFKPVVWSWVPGPSRRGDGTVAVPRVLQVWFCGSHGDVGGGYRESDLAEIPLGWMLQQAGEAGLWFDPARLTLCAAGNCRGDRHDSDRSWVGRLTSGETLGTARAVLGSLPLQVSLATRLFDLFANLFTIRPLDRQIGGEIETDAGTFCVCVGERVHASVLERFRGEMRPESVRKALGSGIDPFHERAEARESVAREPATVGGRPCRLVNLSRTGARVEVAASLEGVAPLDLECTRTGRVPAQLVWQRSGEAGLRLLPVAAVESAANAA